MAARRRINLEVVRPKLAILGLILSCRLFATEVIPPAPAHYFNDYAKVVSADRVAQLNTTLEQFEKESSDQILVVVFPKMQSESSVEDYTVRVARAWKVGQRGKNNGAVLFVFVQDHKMFLQVGYGLEGVLPDALCKRIIDEQISPRFQAGDFTGGLTAGVQSILAAVKGEYWGNGSTVAQRKAEPRQPDGTFAFPIVGLIVLFLVFVLFIRNGNPRSRGRGWIITGSGGGGGWSGGSGGGGGGGFSGGGGSFGGGGAGGSW